MSQLSPIENTCLTHDLDGSLAPTMSETRDVTHTSPQLPGKEEIQQLKAKILALHQGTVDALANEGYTSPLISPIERVRLRRKFGHPQRVNKAYSEIPEGGTPCPRRPSALSWLQRLQIRERGIDSRAAERHRERDDRADSCPLANTPPSRSDVVRRRTFSISGGTANRWFSSSASLPYAPFLSHRATTNQLYRSDISEDIPSQDTLASSNSLAEDPAAEIACISASSFEDAVDFEEDAFWSPPGTHHRFTPATPLQIPPPLTPIKSTTFPALTTPSTFIPRPTYPISLRLHHSTVIDSTSPFPRPFASRSASAFPPPLPCPDGCSARHSTSIPNFLPTISKCCDRRGPQPPAYCSRRVSITEDWQFVEVEDIVDQALEENRLGQREAEEMRERIAEELRKGREMEDHEDGFQSV
ncbi:hypothetical protein FPV67DRAFT_1461842 [Lyophyllum atratum]|nr:hypothetical protein FPV67DRAFT_1461842 [Lyophyllum atratum]